MGITVNSQPPASVIDNLCVEPGTLETWELGPSRGKWAKKPELPSVIDISKEVHSEIEVCAAAVQEARVEGGVRS